MKVILFDNVVLERLEGAKADVQCERSDGGAGGAAGVENLRGEVEAGGGCGDGARLLSEDCLVAFAIRGLVGTVDIGREGDVAGGFDLGVEISLAVEPDEPFTADPGFEDLCFESRGDGDARAFVEVAAGADERGPEGPAVILGPQEEDFNGACVARLLAEEAGREDSGVVYGEAIPGGEEAGEVAEGSIFEGARGAVNDEHAGGGAVREGFLSDELVGQVIIKFRQQHCSSKAPHEGAVAPLRTIYPFEDTWR